MTASLYAVVFLVSGVGLLGLTLLIADGTMRSTVPAPNQPLPGDLGSAQQRIRDLAEQLATVDDQRTRQLLAAALVGLVLMALISVVVGRLLAKRVLRPLRLITAATRISANSLDQRLAVTGPDDEVKELADTIDDLLGRLEASFTAQRRFVANASHELRPGVPEHRGAAREGLGRVRQSIHQHRYCDGEPVAAQAR